jgi:hypothetical protein
MGPSAMDHVILFLTWKIQYFICILELELDLIVDWSSLNGEISQRVMLTATLNKVVQAEVVEVDIAYYLIRTVRVVGIDVVIIGSPMRLVHARYDN